MVTFVWTGNIYFQSGIILSLSASHSKTKRLLTQNTIYILLLNMQYDFIIIIWFRWVSKTKLAFYYLLIFFNLQKHTQ